MRRRTYEHWPKNLQCTHLTTHINDMGVSHRYTNKGWSLGHYTQPIKKLPPNAVWPFVCPKNHLLPIIGDVHSRSQHTAASIVPLNDPFLHAHAHLTCSSASTGFFLSKFQTTSVLKKIWQSKTAFIMKCHNTPEQLPLTPPAWMKHL